MELQSISIHFTFIPPFIDSEMGEFEWYSSMPKIFKPIFKSIHRNVCFQILPEQYQMWQANYLMQFSHNIGPTADGIMWLYLLWAWACVCVWELSNCLSVDNTSSLMSIYRRLYPNHTFVMHAVYLILCISRNIYSPRNSSTLILRNLQWIWNANLIRLSIDIRNWNASDSIQCITSYNWTGNELKMICSSPFQVAQTVNWFNHKFRFYPWILSLYFVRLLENCLYYVYCNSLI